MPPTVELLSTLICIFSFVFSLYQPLGTPLLKCLNLSKLFWRLSHYVALVGPELTM